ncbi:hypothetical protein EHH44_01140 [Mycolicibacter terrae]|uniref:Transposase n=2 Tax=Mycolicibacter TaxID=1073531 RepID=A0A1A2Y0J8_MYCSD|nr:MULTISPECIES: hypothetical protein [Mycolicibacter]OBH19509.1 hypothetical protein A5694_18670 [Mycolicibacter sinensis]OBI30913.1 hypothetical protein A5710_19190 [Mycolicibacter sinensis]RRR48668.1 hypothetical protein EHH44_01140 [Mycolicibacter terrae]
MTMPGAWVWLISGYALLLLVFAWGFDAMAKRTSERAAQWRTGKFAYHEDHDAWKCPQDQWLWPTAFDPANRVMRYRATPSICNACPVKDTCTTSNHGREISRPVDPWPHSEAGRFHRGIACAVAGFGVVMPLATLIANHRPADVLVLGATMALVLAGGSPLLRHLWNTPSNAPDDIAHRISPQQRTEKVEAAIDRYSTRWGGFADSSRRQRNE